ncbi:GPI-GlcNAc transferase complex, PIG-H component-domain-containing protein [Obelidium mucronatum]|nr:GPI-GlcNAc transferase complex, PIG-H component-domain-containing protein [Obelidium mucronatum]
MRRSSRLLQLSDVSNMSPPPRIHPQRTRGKSRSKSRSRTKSSKQREPNNNPRLKPILTLSPPADTRNAWPIQQIFSAGDDYEFIISRPSGNVTEFTFKRKGQKWTKVELLAFLGSLGVFAYHIWLGSYALTIWTSISSFILLGIILRKESTVYKESLFILQNVGIQTQTSTGFSTSTVFIPTAKISEIIINEGITLFQVKYYMAIIVAGEQDMVVAFGVSIELFLPLLPTSCC